MTPGINVSVCAFRINFYFKKNLIIDFITGTISWLTSHHKNHESDFQETKLQGQ